MPQCTRVAVGIVACILIMSWSWPLCVASRNAEEFYELRRREISAWRQNLPMALQRFMVTFCVGRTCNNLSPGQSFMIPESLDIREGHTWVRKGIDPNSTLHVQLWNAEPHKKYCMSVYIDAITGAVCNCLSEVCYSHISALESQVADCVHRACHPRISGEEPLFCNSLLPKQQVRFVPITFRDQTYFTPGIRVLFEQERSANQRTPALPIARNIHLNYESGEVKKVEHVDIAGATYEIVVERKEGQDLVCGTYRYMKRNMLTSCVPTPSIRVPRVRYSKYYPRTIRAVFHGCNDARNCEFQLRVGERSSRFVDLQAVIPSFNYEYSMKQYAACPDHSYIDKHTVDLMRKGSVLCADGSRAQIKYLAGNSNLICLVIGHRFFPEMIVEKKVELFLRTKSAPGVRSIACDVCGEHLAESRVLFRNGQGDMDTSRYGELAMESINAASEDGHGKAISRVPEVLGALIHKNVRMLDFDPRRLISDSCAAISDISLHEQQILLDKIQHVGLGVVYISREDIMRYSNKDLSKSTCTDQQKVMFRYSEAYDDDLDAMQKTESLAEAQDQGLCVTMHNAKIRATSTWYVDEKKGIRHRYKKKEYVYLKSKLFPGCELLRVVIFGAEDRGAVEVILRNKRLSNGVDITFVIGKDGNESSGVTMCPGGINPDRNTDISAVGCLAVMEEYGQGLSNHTRGIVASSIELISVGGVQQLYRRPSPEGEITVTCIQ